MVILRTQELSHWMSPTVDHDLSTRKRLICKSYYAFFSPFNHSFYTSVLVIDDEEEEQYVLSGSMYHQSIYISLSSSRFQFNKIFKHDVHMKYSNAGHLRVIFYVLQTLNDSLICKWWLTGLDDDGSDPFISARCSKLQE